MLIGEHLKISFYFFNQLESLPVTTPQQLEQNERDTIFSSHAENT